MFDVRLLASFVAVARHKSFAKAAAEVHATQPGVSQHIAKLESQLGYKLLERSKRSVALTPAGETVLQHAHHVLQLLTRLQEEGRQIASGELGQLSLGVSSSIFNSDVLLRISDFRKATPRIAFKFVVNGGDLIKSMLDSGELDAAVTTLPLLSTEYRSTVIAQQPIGVAVQAGHPLADRSEIALRELLDEPFIVVPRETYPEFHDKLVARFHHLGGTLKVAAYEVPFLNALARVAVGEGVALIAFGYSVEAHASVRIIPLVDHELAFTPIYAVVRRDSIAKSATERLLNFLMSPSRRYVEQGPPAPR